MDALVLDPVLVRVCQAGLALILLVGALHKLGARAEFEQAVAGYQLLPMALVPAVAWAVPLAEAAAGAMLLADPVRAAGAALGLVLLAVVTAAVVANLVRGQVDIDCGCGGFAVAPGAHARLSWALPARNAVLAVLLVFAGASLDARETMWVDGVSIVFGALAMLALFTVLGQLMANQPLLSALRRPR